MFFLGREDNTFRDGYMEHVGDLHDGTMDMFFDRLNAIPVIKEAVDSIVDGD